jgi:hypothetical protein
MIIKSLLDILLSKIEEIIILKNIEINELQQRNLNIGKDTYKLNVYIRWIELIKNCLNTIPNINDSINDGNNDGINKQLNTAIYSIKMDSTNKKEILNYLETQYGSRLDTKSSFKKRKNV